MSVLLESTLNRGTTSDGISRKIMVFAPLIPYIDSAHGNPSKIINFWLIYFLFEAQIGSLHEQSFFHTDYEADQQYIDHFSTYHRLE